MKTIKENNSERIRQVPDALQRLYQEMNFAVPIFNDDEKEDFLIAIIDLDISIEIHEEQMLDEEIEFDEWYEKYQKKHFRKYGKYLYI